MGRSLNRVCLIGNVGAEPDVRTAGSGTRVAKVSLATSRTFKDRSGSEQEKTDWHRLTFFGKVVDVVERYVHKGDRIYVEGRVEYSQTQDDQGNVKYWTDIIVGELIMLGGSGGGGGPAPAPGGSAGWGEPSTPAPTAFDKDDDLPF